MNWAQVAMMAAGGGAPGKDSGKGSGVPGIGSIPMSASSSAKSAANWEGDVDGGNISFGSYGPANFGGGSLSTDGRTVQEREADAQTAGVVGLVVVVVTAVVLLLLPGRKRGK